MSSPSWYDLLGVAPDASPAEIKAAWREATDKFEPGSGASQFRLFNEAADVLLDPQKRNAYDAELAGGETAEIGEQTVVLDQVETVADDAEETSPEPDQAAGSEDDLEVAAPDDAEPVLEPAVASSRLGRVRALARTTVALVVLGALALASVAFATVVFVKADLGDKADDYKAGRAAQAAAVKALTAVLSYDYRQLDTPAKLEASLNSVTSTMTPDLAERYRTAFVTVCRPDIDSPATAVARQSIVTSVVEDPAIIDAAADRVRLLVFVSQSTSNKDGGPNARSSQVVATMVEREGSWLLEQVETKSQTPPECVEPTAEQTPPAP